MRIDFSLVPFPATGYVPHHSLTSWRSGMVSRIPLAAGLIACLAVASCGPAGPKLVPVTGSVTFNGQPAEGAVVVFQSKSGDANSPKPSGVVTGDGSFTLTTHPHGSGAPAGDYLVAVTWYGENARADNAKNKLPARYADATKSGLTATVKTESTKLEPFVLMK
jgi:hypothetical protein